ncbi:MAG: ATP synthase gamma chain [Candidatus Nomurabacteria bacterium GW2011_GWF2_35_12]|uniref:ATP synthase gamma chain n=2 Tax=Candidatus Nomuraibacteriota TaxID=1752729 RepID=A0A0G0DUA4_9BACT|nr:MAG: ATP synthase gamma chain [Candidatus Nomurabacteria bacterium GW2011_GWF2_35_12]KKP72102.1 MAG: ATP synthase gamma chain [Candidatus Nomurabacteria bacterium GW2011_GWB1_35_20]KKP76429.1 MAG: ATP synthase gamma chain [Parcubacteria group bacterium GW2011_GWC1_35_21]KKP85327.1 MAG: ATP synthase gamma chain [Parcubacteria group bacterium GW2011_GWD2_35_7]KKP98094.1 MAG: ATP synthase gamma chain [Candidatus Nomurabacteria bacterium GW2011_GWA1_36_15]HCY18046.1 ATP synthase F1 subunit gamm
MASTKEIKRRIKSVKNTKKITKAMELVAASKMKRAVSSTLASRLYAEYSWEILTSIARNTEKITHPLFLEREVKNILLLLITSNRGLCGAYNTQIIKKVLFLLKKENENIKIDIITIGKKGDMMMRRVGKNIIASFFELPSNISLSDIVPISELAINEYNLKHYDKVLIAYTDFVSALSQKPNIKQIIPVSKTSLKELIDTLGDDLRNKDEKPASQTDRTTDYLFEGDQDLLIGSLAEKLTRMQIYQMFLESNASEQSSRMVAMKNASEAAGEMIDDLTLVFNKARQSNITREISEISAGMASVS